MVSLLFKPHNGEGGTAALRTHGSPSPFTERGLGGEGENRRRATYEGFVSLETPIGINVGSNLGFDNAPAGTIPAGGYR